MRRRAVGAIVGATALVLASAGYLVADAHDAVPGVLTLSDAPAPSEAPTLTPRSPGPSPDAAQSGTAVTPSQVETLWAPVLRAAGEGKWTSWGTVLDADTGEVLLDAGASRAHTPASTTKILTAVSALSHLRASDTLATGTSLSGTDLYLWGQGDLLLARGHGDADAVDGHAGVADLADATVSVLKEQGITHVTLYWDDQLFEGPAHLQAWDDQGVGNFEGRVGAFAIDTGRTSAGAYSFVPDPARDVATELAANLRDAGIEAEVASTTGVPDRAQEIARVDSATIGQQVRWLLHHSDNTLADQYCRLAARSAGAPTTFAGAVQTLTGTLTDLGVTTTGLKLEDCSGLSSSDRISAATLAGAIRTTMDSSTPQLRDLVRSLPWGGLEGTLGQRYTQGDAAANAQAKTGSLGSVSSLAGVVDTTSGRTLVFAIGNDDVPDGGAYWTRSALDEFIQGLAAL